MTWRRSKLSIKQILEWADTYYEEYGRWPMKDSKWTIKYIRQGLDEKWHNIDASLRSGGRGLRPGGSLARLLAEHRGRRNRKALPKFTIRQILSWADAYHDAHGKWPTVESGPISGAPGETWCAVNAALELGNRGLPPGNSLPRLLAAKRGVKNVQDQPRLSTRQILAWADAYRQRTGMWPKATSGPVAPGVDTSWHAIDLALRRGNRGLRAGQSLARLLVAKRGMPRHHPRKPPFDIQQILRWADAHHARTGRWPNSKSGKIREAPGEAWLSVHKALCFGTRGLAGGSSLGQLLVEQRGMRNTHYLPKHTIRQLLQWADSHHARYGEWPHKGSGRIVDAPGESWAAVARALSRGHRELPAGMSLLQVLSARRGVANRSHSPRLSVPEILAWADACHARTGRWPAVRSGPVVPLSKTTWLHVDNALRKGYRGLPGGTSLFQLLAGRRRIARPRRK